MMGPRVVAFVLAILTATIPGAANALNVGTHRLINRAAAETSTFESLLKTQFGFLRGIREPFRGEEVRFWLGEGGAREDDGFRLLRHFHDPLQPWDTAGLSGLFGLAQFESSVRWMQRGDNKSSWQKARGDVHTAVTSKNSGERDEAWAKTFRALGQIMHLVVDASVPEHVRNDLHPQEGICRFFGFRCLGNYEHWVSDEQAAGELAFRATYLSAPIGFDPAILRQPTGDAQAPVPVARLIDTDTYTGADPNVTLTPAIGIAEFANANFFSEDTVSLAYPFPDVDRLVPSQHPVPRTGRIRAYFAKGAGDGIPVDPVAAECVLYEIANAEGVVEPITRMCQDENVWAATAGVMLPRALGYSRGVVDYFFRGRIEIAPPDRFVYGLASFQEGNTGAFTRLRFKVRNATPNEETGSGDVIAVVQYRTADANLLEQPGASLSAELSFAVSEPQMVTLTRSFQELVFDFSQSPIPTNAADLFLTVVYRGALGLELDAVLVGGKDLFEPDPVDIANVTDYFCFNGTLFQVSILPPFPLLNPPDPTTDPHPRDVNRDGAPDLFGPVDESGIFAKVSRFFTFASATNSDLQVPQRAFAQYTRFFILQDQRFYVLSRLVQTLIERGVVPNAVSSNARFAVLSEGIINRFRLLADGRVVHEFDSSFTYRGVVTLGITLFIPQNIPSFLPCLAASFTVTPALTRIEGTLAEP